MNKKETAAFEQLKHELRLAKALSWTQPIAPDLQPPSTQERGDRLVKGWLFNAYSNGYSGDKTAIACTSSIHHSWGNNDKTTTQGPRHLFSTELRALQALRHEVELQCARRLASIDERIERELALDASPNGTDE